jgi:hypothetical protein
MKAKKRANEVSLPADMDERIRHEFEADPTLPWEETHLAAHCGTRVRSSKHGYWTLISTAFRDIETTPNFFVPPLEALLGDF